MTVRLRAVDGRHVSSGWLNEHGGHRGAGSVNPSYATERFDAKFARYISWALRSSPGIGSDIKKPDTVEPV